VRSSTCLHTRAELAGEEEHFQTSLVRGVVLGTGRDAIISEKLKTVEIDVKKEGMIKLKGNEVDNDKSDQEEDCHPLLPHHGSVVGGGR
jgi:hypothetical protein